MVMDTALATAATRRKVWWALDRVSWIRLARANLRLVSPRATEVKPWFAVPREIQAVGKELPFMSELQRLDVTAQAPRANARTFASTGPARIQIIRPCHDLDSRGWRFRKPTPFRCVCARAWKRASAGERNSD